MGFGAKLITSELITFRPKYPNTFLKRILRCIHTCIKNMQFHLNKSGDLDFLLNNVFLLILTFAICCQLNTDSLLLDQGV